MKIYHFILFFYLGIYAQAVPSLYQIKASLSEQGKSSEKEEKRNIPILFNILKKIEAGGDPNIVGKGDITPLVLAMQIGNRPAIEYLLAKGANPFWKNKEGKTAIDFGNNEDLKIWLVEQIPIQGYDEALDVVNRLIDSLEKSLENKSEEDKNSYDGSLLLVHKYERCKRMIEILKELKDGKCPMNERNHACVSLPRRKGVGGVFMEEHTPLSLSVKMDLPQIASFLLKNGADVNGCNKFCIPMIFAARNGNVKLMQLLLKKGASISNKGVIFEKRTDVGYEYSPLESAIMSSNLDAVKFLLKKEASLTQKRTSPLSVAVEFSNREMLEYLLSIKAPDLQQALFKTIEKGNISSFKYLIEKGAEIEGNFSGQSPLSCAAAYNQMEMVKYLIAKGADVNLPNEWGFTAVTDAAMFSNLDVLKYLLSLDVSKNTLTNALTHIVSRADRGFEDAVKLLLERGADPKAVEQDAPNGVGHPLGELLKTFLDLNRKQNQEARKQEAQNILSLLIKKGININAITVPDSHKTGLMEMAEQACEQDLDCIDYVLSLGADPNIKDKEGKTAADHAKDETVKKHLLSKMK